MKSAYDSSIFVQKSTCLTVEDDTTAEAFSVPACLAEIEILIKGTWGSDIRFDLRVSPGIPTLICGRIGLQSAVMILLLNARDAIPAGGVISVDAVAIHVRHVATEVEVRVADNGLGMRECTLLHAIDPFFTTKTTGLGGLGLPMVASFAEEAGGRLYMESEPGDGTIATSRLPVPGSETHRPLISPQLSRIPGDILADASDGMGAASSRGQK